MVRFLKLGVALALASPCIAAATCTSNECIANDEVSLMQVNQIVNKRRPAKSDSDKAELMDTSSKKAQEEQAPVNWQATIDSMPYGVDGGVVVDSYENAKGKIADAIASNTKSDLRYEDQVRDIRRFDREYAKHEVAKDAAAVHFAVEAERNNVVETAKKRKLIEEKAKDKIDVAKAHAEAVMEKERQAEDASVLGRLDGVRAGYQRADREVLKRNKEWANELEDRKLEEAEAHAEHHKKEVREAIKAVSDRMRKDQETWALRSGDNAQDIIKKVRADAHEAEQGIEGGDGLKNRLIKDYANGVAEDYNRIAYGDQKDIMDDSFTKWPKGDWPVVEPGTPPIPDPLVPSHID